MAQMPRIGPDPFAYADQYNQQMTQLGAQGEQNAQNALMQMFRIEAARQQPFIDLPVDLAKQNNAARNAFGNSVALANYKQSIKPSPGLKKTTDMIYQTAKSMGVDPILALTIADIETGGRFDPNAKNPNSSAYGLFQQIDANWAQYGRGMDRTSAQDQTRAGLLYMRDVINAIESSGAKVTPGLVYFGYQQGPGALKKALQNPKAPVEAVLGTKAARLNGARPGQTIESFMQKWVNEGNRRYEKHKAVRSRQDDDGKEELLARLKEAFQGPDGSMVQIVGRDEDDDAS